ncbi:hypothetical protein EVC45_13235 [Paraburkholderia sp. UYCP14C]|uniref:hypothetical protein n=1 Tax=Paraburkholderia sp. UYCP14C TaxID=2511130 RepID=UPI00101FEF14|nr:hypothetical protein [Paraburkholderia sp. UYCP14C]RZF29407.1 hypothetical protein EVC45_13235 [Paraburkholderia sp. UYCP14C]
MAAFGSTAASANDIQCATTRQAAERVICDHAILNNEYDDIFAQQQALLSSGKLSSAQLAQWRQARNACIDVHCVDGVFDKWKTMARSVQAGPQAAAPVVTASETAMAPVGPNPEAPPVASAAEVAPTSQALPTSEASLVRQGSAAGVALPQPVAPEASAPAAASAAPGERASSSMTGMPGMGGGLIAVLLIALAAGVFFALRNRSSATAKRTQRKNGR